MKVSLSDFLLITGLFISATSQAQTIPAFTGETLDNKTVSIPADTKGKYTFLCFASSMKAQKELESWLDPVYNKFVAKTGLMDEFYDVHVFFIPIFKGSNASMQETVRKKFNETAQADIKDHVLFCNNDLSAITTALNFHNEDTPHFVLLDMTGEIIYRTSGAFTEKKFDEIDDMIE